MTETIASLAEPVGNLPARRCFVMVRRLTDSKDIEMGVSLNSSDSPFHRY